MDEKYYIKKLKKWKKLLNKKKMNIKKREKLVSFFANSSLPNSWFLIPFCGKPEKKLSIFYTKYNWELFARVLVFRGLEKLGNDASILLEYLYEPYYDSNRVVRQFVLENYDIYNSLIKNYIKNLNQNSDYLLARDIVESLCDELVFSDKKYDRLCELLDNVYYKKSSSYQNVVNEICEIVNHLLDKYLLNLSNLPKYY